MKTKLLLSIFISVLILFGCNQKEESANKFDVTNEMGMAELAEHQNMIIFGLKERLNKMEKQINDLNNSVLLLSEEFNTKMAVPHGTIIAYAGPYVNDMIKDGWLVCDGSPLDSERPENRALFAAIGVMYGGDGKPTFYLPNLEGQFLRGYTENPKLDPGIKERYKKFNGKKILSNAIGSFQDDEIKTHLHEINVNHTTKHAHCDGGSGFNAFSVGEGNCDKKVEKTVDYMPKSNESRPKNVYVHFLIKR